MSKKQHIPTLRFKDDSGELFPEWEEQTLGEVFSFKTTNSFSRDDLNYEDGTVKNIHYGDIHTKFVAQFHVSRELVPFVNSDISLNKIKAESYCQNGDIVFADASENLQDVGKCIEVINTGEYPLLAGLHTLLARPNNGVFSAGFAAHLFTSEFIRLQIQKEAQGTKVLSISASRLAGIQLPIPSLPEQQKIASFLSAVDENLQTLKRKKELLEQYKKGAMQQIFSQELRFKDANGEEFEEWEEKMGNEVFDSISDKDHNSDLPILAITQDQGAVPRDLIDYQVSVSDKSVESYKVVQIDDFIISLRSFQGGIEHSRYQGICSPAYIILRAIIPISHAFYKYYLKTDGYIKLLNKNLEGIRDGKMISYKYFSEIPLPYPSLPEQQKIATFLSALDDKINLVQSQIEKTEAWKKGLLQKLFV